MRLTRGASFVLVLALLVAPVLATARASAQEAATSSSAAPPPSPTDVQQAREAFQVAVSLYAAGRYAEAAQEFERSYTLSHEGGLLRNLYLARRDAGDARGAAEALRAYLAAGAPETTDDDRRQLEHRLAALDRALASEDAEATARAQREAETRAAEAREAAQVEPDAHEPTALPALADPDPVTPLPPASVDVTSEPWFWAVLATGVVVIGGGIALAVALTTPGPGMDGDVLGRIETLRAEVAR